MWVLAKRKYRVFHFRELSVECRASATLPLSGTVAIAVRDHIIASYLNPCLNLRIACIHADFARKTKFRGNI